VCDRSLVAISDLFEQTRDVVPFGHGVHGVESRPGAYVAAIRPAFAMPCD
jgi:hypothetical protein